jgi:hypothetical protein
MIQEFTKITVFANGTRYEFLGSFVATSVNTSELTVFQMVNVEEVYFGAEASEPLDTQSEEVVGKHNVDCVCRECNSRNELRKRLNECLHKK